MREPISTTPPIPDGELIYERKEIRMSLRNVSEIADFCCRTVGDISSDALDFAKSAIRLKYQTLYDAHSWRESQRAILLTIDPTLNGSVFLPYDAEEMISFALSRDNQNFFRLVYRERDWIERQATPLFSLPGNNPWVYRAENLAWPGFNPGKFTFTTLDPNSFTVYIEGKTSSDVLVGESFLLNAVLNPDGTITPSSVTSANSYKIVTSLSKTATAANLTIAPEVGAATQIPPAMDELIYSHFRLYPDPIFIDQDGNNLALYARIIVKLKADTLANDMSVPRISHIWDALIEFTLSSLYTRGRQLTKADAREQKAIQHVQAAVNVEKNQSEFRQQVVPVIYEQGDYIGHGDVVSSAYPFG